MVPSKPHARPGNTSTTPLGEDAFREPSRHGHRQSAKNMPRSVQGGEGRSPKQPTEAPQKTKFLFEGGSSLVFFPTARSDYQKPMPMTNIQRPRVFSFKPKRPTAASRCLRLRRRGGLGVGEGGTQASETRLSHLFHKTRQRQHLKTYNL